MIAQIRYSPKYLKIDILENLLLKIDKKKRLDIFPQDNYIKNVKIASSVKDFIIQTHKKLNIFNFIFSQQTRDVFGLFDISK